MSTPLPQTRVRVQRIAEAAVERARLTVVPRRRSRVTRVPFITLVSLILLGGVVGLLMFNTSMQQNAFAATALEQQANSLGAKQQNLEMELDVLRDPQRVALEAQKQGMLLPATVPAFLDLAKSKVLGGTPPPVLPGSGLDVRDPGVKKPKSIDPPEIIVPAKQTPKKKTTKRTQQPDTGVTSRHQH